MNKPHKRLWMVIFFAVFSIVFGFVLPNVYSVMQFISQFMIIGLALTNLTENK